MVKNTIQEQCEQAFAWDLPGYNCLGDLTHLENRKQIPQKKLKNKKMQINLLLRNKGKKEFYLLWYLFLMDYLNHLYVTMLNVLNLKQQLQMVKRNAN